MIDDHDPIRVWLRRVWRLGVAWLSRKRAAWAQPPVAANQLPPGEVTNTMGAMQGRGRLVLCLVIVRDQRPGDWAAIHGKEKVYDSIP